jgi:hypothetical protein
VVNGVNTDAVSSLPKPAARRELCSILEMADIVRLIDEYEANQAKVA